MPFTEEEYAMLRGGPEGIAQWNELRESEEHGSDRPELGGADLSGVQLTGADLFGANLSEADLSEADLSLANLSLANLSWADLSQANLSGARLVKADLIGANLRCARLPGAFLSMADLTGTSLRETILSRASLDNALLRLTDLTDATVEDANITGVVLHELRGLPRPPSRLRLKRNEEEIILTGAEAANFFVLPAVVEVYLTRTLSETEVGALQFHFGEVHANKASRDVYLVGHRHEHDGSVLRFQGPTYEAVYDALPDLLAPFRTAAAIDWKATLESIPKGERPGALAALVKAEARLVKGRWVIAERLAQSFEGFANARVVRLTEGRSKGVSITVATDDTILEKVARTLLPVTALNAATVIQNATFHEGSRVGDTTVNVGGAIVGSAIGTQARVSTGGNITTEISQVTSPALAELAGAVRQTLALLDTIPLTKADREQAEKHIEDIQAEATKTPPNPEAAGKVREWLDSLTKLCKPAADLVAEAKAVIVALGLGG